MRGLPNVFTIAPGVPFLSTLVEACLNGQLGFAMGSDPRDLSAVTIYVPTRRAARALIHSFTTALRPQALLLPRVVPLGDPADLDESAMLGDDTAFTDQTISPAVTDIDRRLALAKLVEGWRSSGGMKELAQEADGFTLGGSFADSFALAGELASLIDEFALEGIDWRSVAALAPPEHDQYWSMTQSFLAIAGEMWPQHTSKQALLDPAERLNRQLTNAAMHMRANPPAGPVIAAGSTGSVPATAALLATIARLPLGAVILPGLDKAMDEETWQLVADDAAQPNGQPGHPQAALKMLLQRIGIERSSVGELGTCSAALSSRARILQAAMRPADATDIWPQMREAMADDLPIALEKMAVLEARDEREEALAIAIALRGALEQAASEPERTAALITPDRALAARVVSELKRWGIAVDDSAGQSLSLLPAGSRARLVLAASSCDARPVDLMALLHTLPDASAAVPHTEVLEAIELAGLRNNDVASGPDGWAKALTHAQDRINDKHAPQPLKRVTADAVYAATALLSRVHEHLAPLIWAPHERRSISDWAKAHGEVVTALACGEPDDRPDTRALFRLLDQLTLAHTQPMLTFADYAMVFEQLCNSVAVVSGVGGHGVSAQGRIKIFGLLEARLIPCDLVVLGGLNERTWPPDARTDSFLNRAMRAQLGLSSPERRIGQSAHDFVQALGCANVLLTRAKTVEGTPTVASRFLRRLDTFIGAVAAKAMREKAGWLTQAAHDIDAATPIDAAPRPKQGPAGHMQPSSLSITEIATLYRDPYAIYARHILQLSPLPALDEEPGARDRGTIIHEALARFIAEASIAWPDNAEARLLEIGREVFGPLMKRETTAAFWWPLFERMAGEFVRDEQEQRQLIAHSVVETRATLPLTLGDGTQFTLRGKPDRIDVLKDGSAHIIDYKTGTIPSGKLVYFALEPQLTLAAAMALKGAFATVSATQIKELTYMTVGSDFARRSVSFTKPPGKDEGIDAIALKHLDQLIKVLDRLRSGEETFISRRMPQKTQDVGDYDHLARVQEWIAQSDGE